MSKNGEKQNGFTLIEVLLSIILLFIILTSFMGFFTQSALFSKKNEQKLGTIQSAQKVINLVEMNVTKQILENDMIIDSNGNVLNNTCLLTKAEIENYIDDTIDPNFDASAVITNNSSENLILFKISIQDLKKPDNISETYTYIRR